MFKIGIKNGGIVAGSEAGLKGYFLTFAIAYIRDMAADYCYIAESIETSCPWSKVSTLVANVRERIYSSCKKHGILEDRMVVSFRVT